MNINEDLLAEVKRVKFEVETDNQKQAKLGLNIGKTQEVERMQITAWFTHIKEQLRIKTQGGLVDMKGEA